ncbi:hypothetical protein MOE86_15530 [Bacillus atrophaeus]|uniref:hypothetical protein n=1 Tax=Bacillus atrophaeus TaxID=1452 RepID=UPI00228220DB|nr:hypothetical protein [Bacillus atrophaeus]MCY9198089.1 hypothetical protein [Bacillus atrophaeus]
MARSKANNRRKGYEKRQQDRQLEREKLRLRKVKKKNETKPIVKGLRKEDSLYRSFQDLADQLHESRQNEALLKRYMKTEEQKNEKLQLQIEKLAKINNDLKNTVLIHRIQLVGTILGIIVLMISAFLR